MPFTTPEAFVPSITRQDGARAYWFAFRKRELLVSEQFALPCVGTLEELGLTAARTHCLGQLGADACMAAELAPDSAAPPGAMFVDLRGLFGRIRDELLSVAGRAVQIVEWDRTHRYCGSCATPTNPAADRRSRLCPSCGLESFPRLSPAIIVAVERGAEILLARSPHFPPEVHSVLAGFVDVGESVEEAVRREVLEETGLTIRDVRYFGSQPWPFPGSLMLGFQATYESGDIRIDGTEITSAAFYRPDALPKVFPGRFSIAQWLLHDFLARHA